LHRQYSFYITDRHFRSPFHGLHRRCDVMWIKIGRSWIFDEPQAKTNRRRYQVGIDVVVLVLRIVPQFPQNFPFVMWCDVFQHWKTSSCE
jgi:hypothetical protein